MPMMRNRPSFGGVLLRLSSKDHSRKTLPLLVVLFAVSLFLCSKVQCAPADNVLMPTFGSGKAKVRIYTDYFCGPCSALEPKLESMLIQLVKSNVATVTFIDTPIHAPTPTYARYFLYIVNERADFDYVLRMRAVLFDAAKQNLTKKEQLEEYLQKNQVKFKEFDTKPTFSALQKCLDEDGINSTPTAVVYSGPNKSVYKGGDNIMKGLGQLK